MAKITRKDKQEFSLYVKALTDQQVIGVYEKEKKANRMTYAKIAMAEADKRGISL
jgi:hypothetical protein